MKVIIDNKIPYLEGVLEAVGIEAVFLPGREFTPAVVKDADALLVRTRTRCDRRLLEGSRVRFIGTATIGYDHIDTAYCAEAGIAWCNCPGCNAGAVEQYVHAVLLLLQQEKGISLAGTCLGVIGVGHVGSRICRLGERLGMRVLQNDPPRADRGEEGFADLAVLARECDILSFHTPLLTDGPYRTFHLADAAFFHSLARRPYVINTSRGEVMATDALLEALDGGQVAGAVLDVWENEPDIDLRLLDRVFIGTPHIAGYSADGKANATRMVLEAFSRFFGIDVPFQADLPALPEAVTATDPVTRQLQAYNPHRDCEALRACPALFEQLRGDYPLRRE